MTDTGLNPALPFTSCLTWAISVTSLSLRTVIFQRRNNNTSFSKTLGGLSKAGTVLLTKTYAVARGTPHITDAVTVHVFPAVYASVGGRLSGDSA